MKNLTKIFMAVVAGMFAFSCVTDTTEDLGVQVGGGEGLTTITLSLEESRTQLGEKAGQQYPLYWTAGDKISVNGVEAEAQISTTNPAVATFAVAEAEKYEVVYPATTEGVLFAAKQNHVVEGDTFESGVSTMYGTGVAGEPIALHHLTGVLKFAVTGEAVLSKIQISTIDRAPIAGAFDIDFATGELTATKASKNVIEYSFGEEGLQLTEEAQWMHVAVPAGQYDELYLTIYEKGNSGNIMYATVKAGESKPLAAGGVREFNTPIVYAPNAQVFVINSAEQLVKFKADIEAEGGLAMDAVLTEDIDMKGVEWTPISGANYVNTIHGNGYAIKGLTAPLFWTTSASIKGLHLVDVDIETNVTSSKHGYYGVLAGILTPAEGVTELRVENCSVSGKVYIHNPNFAGDNHFWFGGMIGQATGVNIDSCISDIEIKASEYPTGEGKTKNFAIGGLVGMAAGIGEMYTTVTNSKNCGDLDLRPGGRITTLIVGGLISYSQKTNPGFIMKNCENSGKVTFVAAENGTAKNLAYVGGVIGFIGDCQNSEIDNVKNSGAIEFSNLTVNAAVTTGGCYVAGCIPHITNLATATESVPSITNLTNTGDINVNISVTSATATPYIAGCVGHCCTSLTTATNTGNITMSGKTGGSLVIGGVASALQAGAAYTECVNSGKITISGVVGDESIEGSATTATASVGGLFGETTAGTSTNITRCQNHGSIEFTKDAKVANSTYSGGILASHVAAVAVVVEDCWNSGNLTFNGTSSARKANTFYIAGGIGHTVTEGSFSMKGYLINSGNISVNGNTTNTKYYFAVGGVIGRSTVSFALAEGATEAKIANTGSVSTTCSVSVAAYVGGVIACTSKAIADGIEIVNIGDITVTGSFTAATRNIGGAIGTAANNLVPYAKSYCTVTAIDANGKADYSTTAGMIMGAPYQAGKYEVKAGAAGGTIICESIEDPNSGTATDGPGELTSENWFKYIYGSELTAAPEGIQFLTEAPVVTLPTKLPAAK